VNVNHCNDAVLLSDAKFKQNMTKKVTKKLTKSRQSLSLQGSVATKLSYGGKFFILVMSHFFLIPTLKEF